LNVEVVRQGFENKLPVGKKVIAELGLQPDQVCHIGDDLTDLSLLQYVGLSVAVADAAADVRAAAHYVTTAPGGRGAVREVVELLLKAKHRWEDLIRSYAV
jgi:YrbI family 3-deoxy-D-manno-octulosonate 8-phosphate phosphatase